jgi:glycosyltransferase involved in cell wall biosynthesis
MERAFPQWRSAGDAHWLVPNQERFPKRQLRHLAWIDHVLAKSLHGAEIFDALGARARHVGFTSVDRLDPSVAKDWNSFLHLAGASTLKGTEDILDLWRHHPEWPELVLVQKAENAPRTVPANVRLLSGYLDDSELQKLQNACGLHLCPSRAEGWGHHIIEGLSVGAVVVTTDAPPMNEHVLASNGILVAFERQEPRHLGTSFFVDRKKLEAAIEAILAMPATEKARLGTAARERYMAIDMAFRRNLRAFCMEAGGPAAPGSN